MALKEYRVLLHGRTETTAMYDEDAARKLGLTEADLVENTPKVRGGRNPRTNGRSARVKVAAAPANKAAAPADDKSIAAKAKEAAGIEDPDGDGDDDQDENAPDPTGRGF